jgi:hypothetical protein
VEIVLIDGNAVDAFLKDVRLVSDFLVDLHRRLVLRVP